MVLLSQQHWNVNTAAMSDFVELNLKLLMVVLILHISAPIRSINDKRIGKEPIKSDLEQK